MDIIAKAALEEIPKITSALVIVLAGWFVGNRISIAWNLKQKRKEYDLESARDFHQLYGEFFAIWKLWNYFIRDIGEKALQGGSRWDLLSRASQAEGKLESMLVRICCDRAVSDDEIEALGQFRQIYQQLREAIRDNKPLPWDSSEHDDYISFKQLAPKVASIIVGVQSQRKSRLFGETLVKITSNRWEHHIRYQEKEH